MRKELYRKFDLQPTLKFKEACVTARSYEKADKESETVINVNKLQSSI